MWTNGSIILFGGSPATQDKRSCEEDMYGLYAIGFIAACIIAVLLTPWSKICLLGWSCRCPNHRKVHTRIMPRLGGLAIFLAFVGAYFVVSPALDAVNSNAAFGLLLGGLVIVITGALDDRFQLSPNGSFSGSLLRRVSSFPLASKSISLTFRSERRTCQSVG